VCEYCGCQALTPIAELTAEHDAVVALIGHATTGLLDRGLAGSVPYLEQIVDLLEVHTVVEENGLFPALAGEFGPHVDRLVEDHRAIDEAFRAVVACSEAISPVVERTLVDALYRLREHILAEQDGAFPAALAILSPEQWDHIVGVRRAAVQARLAAESPPPIVI
jgi:Hemerythrin HHE cation binding domain